ncbi:MAG: HD domain-containing protein [Eubacterium sp.]|nr:HD domain-containing protein [Eubacterium sp.]
MVESALQFAAVAHKGQLRKGGRIPYFAHVLEASGIVHKISDEAELIAAAALHDVVEDAGVTVDELRERFGDHVADLVASVSENKRSHLPAAETWEIRKKEALEALREAGLETKTLVLGDKLSNMRSCKRDHDVEGDAMWEKFNCKDKRMQKRYYHDVLDALGELSDTYAYKELKTLIDDVFE